MKSSSFVVPGHGPRLVPKPTGTFCLVPDLVAQFACERPMAVALIADDEVISYAALSPVGELPRRPIGKVLKRGRREACAGNANAQLISGFKVPGSSTS
jgi:hypothetical protein